LIIAALAAVTLASTTAITAIGSTGGRSVRQVVQCGIERWTIKTLQDRPRLLPIRTVTIGYLVSRPKPLSLPPTRLPFERHLFRVTAAVTLVRPEP
jgi:hypothetical protein